jgi:hypothetical protein
VNFILRKTTEFFGENNCGLHLFRQLIGIAKRPAGAIVQAFRPALLITFKDLGHS